MAGSAEQKKQYHVSKAFKGLNTKANRTAIEDDEFSQLENAQPVGPGNLRIIPGPNPSLNAAVANVIFSGNVATMASVALKNSTYMVEAGADGAAEIYDVATGNTVTILAAGNLSTSGVSIGQFSNQQILLADPTKGLFAYDGNVTVAVGSVGAIGMANVGSGYTTAPGVTFSAPDQPGGVRATGDAVLVGSVVSEILVTQAGTGYLNPPSVTLTGGGGSGAVAVASLITFRTGTVYATVVAGGTGYGTSATITLSGGGGDGHANAVAILSNGAIINVIMDNLGNNYTSAPTVVVTGAGTNAVVTAHIQSNAVTSVASYAGRTWVSQGREISYSSSLGFNDFITISSGSIFVTDATLHGNVLGLLSANNFLYFWGVDSFNVISDVVVDSTGATQFTNTNLSASIGTLRGYSVFPYYRYVMFMNDYGVYGLIGSTMVKLSDALDGLYPYVDFTKPITAGQCIINNILCAVFNFFLTGYVNNPGRWVQAVFFDKKWFLSSQGSPNFVAGSPVGGQLSLFGASGKQLFKLYDNSLAPISSIVQTALWPLTDPIRDKQAIQGAIEATLVNGAIIDLSVDSPSNSSSVSFISNTATWANATGTILTWTNSLGNTAVWLSGSTGYALYRFDAQQWGKYIGFTMTSNSPAFIYNTFELEYEQRARF